MRMKGQNMRECEVCRRRSGNDRCCQILQVKSARISFSPARGRTREEMASKGGTRAAGTDRRSLRKAVREAELGRVLTAGQRAALETRARR